MNVDQGNGFIEVQGIKCWLPPKPADHLIQNYGKKKREQKWCRRELPVFSAADVDVFSGTEYKPDDVVSWDEAEREEHICVFGTDCLDVDRQGNEKRVIGVNQDPNYSMDCLESFRAEELDRIKNGHWIFINGKPYYLTGLYYFFLSQWKLKDGYAEFRYTDLELTYVWEHVKKSKNFLGIVYVTIRGVGKSYLAGCIKYHTAILKRNAATTIQSISDDKAAEFFRDKVLLPIKELPRFLVPINKHGSSDITSQATFDMSPPARKGMSMNLYNSLKKMALYSRLIYSNASETGADGGTWDVIVADEFAKTPPATADVYQRTMINYFTVLRGARKMGNQFLCSTAGEMDAGGGIQGKKIWDNSDHYRLTESGMTNTGLVRFFRSDIDATFFDEFGFPVIEATTKEMQDFLEEKYGKSARLGARHFHDTKRKQLARSGDQQGLIAYKQANPRTPEEAFWIGAQSCIYNADILLTAKEKIVLNGNKCRRGDIVWKTRDKEAIFVDNPANGRWDVSFFNFEPNQVNIGEGTFSPRANHKRIMALDPYSVMTLADDKQGSDGAAAVYNRYDMNINEDFCDTIIADYVFRPRDPFEFYEDMLAAAFYFGCAMFVETNKSNAMDYFRTRGYKWGGDSNPQDFIWERPVSTFTKTSDKPTDGLYQNRGTIEHYTNSTALHIIEHGHKLKHLRVIDDWLLFNPLKTKQFDLAVASSMAIVGAERNAVANLPKIDLGDIFATYNNTGAASVRN